MRDKNGNCMPFGGSCTAVGSLETVCGALQNAYNMKETMNDNEMTDKEKLDLLERYVMTLLTNRIDLLQRTDRFNKVELAYMHGEIDTLSKITNFIKKEKERIKRNEY